MQKVTTYLPGLHNKEEVKATLELDRRVKFVHMVEMLILKLFLVDLANREGYSAMTRTEYPIGIIA